MIAVEGMGIWGEKCERVEVNWEEEEGQRLDDGRRKLSFGREGQLFINVVGSLGSSSP
jgi:hypothetical protein